MEGYNAGRKITGRPSLRKSKSVEKSFSSNAVSPDLDEGDAPYPFPTVRSESSCSENEKVEDNRSHDTSNGSLESRKIRTPKPMPERKLDFKKSVVEKILKILSALVICGFATICANRIRNGIYEANCPMQTLYEMYPNHTRALQTLENALDGLKFQKGTSAVYLLLNRRKEHHFQIRVFVKNVANTFSDCLNYKNHPEDIADIFGNTDYGMAIRYYQEKVKEGSAAFVVNLDKVPLNAVRSLHYICDTHSPLIKDVVVFLTLTVSDEDAEALEKQPVQKSREILNKLWEGLDENVLQPLVTRVTDQVLVLN